MVTLIMSARYSAIKVRQTGAEFSGGKIHESSVASQHASKPWPSRRNRGNNLSG